MNGRSCRAPALALLAAASFGAAALAAASTVPASPETPNATRDRSWHFEVRLDDRPIGEHRFVLSGLPAGGQQLRGEARFTVRLLGIPVYRYRHAVEEEWRGDCLRALQAETDDNGRATEVRARRDGARWQLQAPAGAGPWPDCLMSFAYWHPALPSQTRLLNPQTGRVEAVRVQRSGTGTIVARGRPVPAVRWQLQTAEQAIDLWLAESDGDWVGLDSTLAGGRRLSYRLP